MKFDIMWKLVDYQYHNKVKSTLHKTDFPYIGT